MHNIHLKLNLAGAAILLLAIAAPAYADNLKPEWGVCDTTEDCTYVRNEKSCDIAVVNKKFKAEAEQYISAKTGDGRSVGMEQGSPRCLNQPDAYCVDHACKLAVHPE